MRVGVEVAGGLIGFWLCGQSKRPHQSHATGASHNLPSCFSSVYATVTQCNQQERGWMKEKRKERFDMEKSTRTGADICVYVNKARVRRQRKAGRRQCTAEARGPKMRGSPDRRDVVELCL